MEVVENRTYEVEALLLFAKLLDRTVVGITFSKKYNAKWNFNYY